MNQVLLVVSVDTEEDNWTPSRNNVTVENIRGLPRLHAFLQQFGIRPTYFANYQVAVRPWAADILRNLQARGDAEIAAHLHPWNTPPLEEPFAPRNTMLNNLPAVLQRAKLERVTHQLTRVLGTAPTAFRAGRFGLGRELVPALVRGGYRVDSSVTPYVSWQEYDGGPNFIGAPMRAYRLGARHDPRIPSANGALLELPITCGFSRHPFALWSYVHRVLDAPALRRLRAPGIASRLGMIRKIVLSPETDTPGDMLTLSRRLIESGTKYLHLFLHSSTLFPGLSPFTPTAADVSKFCGALEAYLEDLTTIASVRFATVSEAAEIVMPSRH